MGNYDAIIIGHSQFERIPISDERQEAMLRKQIDNLEMFNKFSIWMRLPEEKALPFHDMGAYEKSTDVNQIAAVYKKYRENPETAYLGCSGSNVSREDDHRTAGRGNG